MKQRTAYICKECGARFARWQGKCSNCEAWDSLVEEIIAGEGKKLDSRFRGNDNKKILKEKVITLGEVDTEGDVRMITGINELDRVLGGGIIPGSLILVGGDPGIGKSTLMLQMAGKLAKFEPLYVTGEESLQQVKIRSHRLSGIPDDLLLLSETNIEEIAAVINSIDSKIIIVDSIQAVYSDRIDATPGSIIQVRECTSLLMQIAKSSGKAIFITGHVTKEGIIAGPKVLEHTVDTVLQFEGEKTYSYRILRAVKNRFGSTNEIGIFEMGVEGLTEVINPSELFIAHRTQEDSGVAIVAAIEGTRPILLEVQALVTPSGFSVPQRTSTGYDIRRLNMILAVLEKRLGEKFRQMDVFVNVAGGIYLNDPAVDLGIAAAMVSSLRDIPISSKLLIIGEIGLTGEVRPISAIEQRINEAAKLGFEKAILPAASLKKINRASNIKLIPVERISLALSMIIK